MTRPSRRTVPRGSRVRARVAGAALAVVVAVLMAAPIAAAQSGGDPDACARVYRDSCAMCHGGDATGMMGMHPALRGAVDRLGLEGVEVAVRDGRATNPPMPAFGGRLTDREIADVKSLPNGPRNFGPGHDDGMAGGMMDGGPTWMVLVVILAAALTGVIGYLIGTSHSRRP